MNQSYIWIDKAMLKMIAHLLERILYKAEIHYKEFILSVPIQMCLKI